MRKPERFSLIVVQTDTSQGIYLSMLNLFDELHYCVVLDKGQIQLKCEDVISLIKR
ncbi:hypothetical protein D3C87_1918100 [compost metagenome]